MISLARLSIHRPKSALLTWIAVAAALTVVGFGVSNSLSPSISVVPGTQSARYQQLSNAQFGPTQLVPILLEGPPTQLSRQGPALVRALLRRPHTRVLSPWDSGTASAQLRPNPTARMILVSVDRSEKDAVRYDQPQIENLVATHIAAPVRSYISGEPSLDRAEQQASTSTLRRDELIACAVMFLLLLVGLRAPVAAVLLTALGTATVLSSFGIVALLGHLLVLDPVGNAAGTMCGLALSVGFALLVLDRFHRELGDDAHPRDAAEAALRTLTSTGRAVLVAGTAVVLALIVVAGVGPTKLMISVGAATVVCAAFATGAAVVVMPAALVLLGRRIEAGRFPAPPPLVRAWSRLVGGGNWVTRHAVFAGAAATALLLALAVPAFALKSGPASVKLLPPGSKARIAFQEISRVMGPGWATPYSMVIVARNRPITTPALLESIYLFERQIAKQPSVDSVTGPGAIVPTSKQLSTFEPQLNHSASVSESSKKQLVKLINGLGQAGSGSAQLQSGLAQASSGAAQLHGGAGQAQTGAGALHSGLAQAKTGSVKLRNGLNQALAGARALQSGASQALTGSSLISHGLGEAAPQVKSGLPAVGALATASAKVNSGIAGVSGSATGAQTHLANAASELKTAASSDHDPRLAGVLNELSAASQDASAVSSELATVSSSASTASGLAAAVKSQVAKLSPGLTALATGAAQLETGIRKLRNGNGQLATAMGQLAGGGGQLHSGLSQLTAGAGTLQIGLGQLTGGAGQLATALAGGVNPAGQLTSGLGTMQAAVVKSRGQIPSTAQLRMLERQSPGIFGSGYFVLAAIAGSPANRNSATFTINLLRGGNAGQVVVVSKYDSGDSRAIALGTTLDHMAGNFAKATNTAVAVGGPAGSLGDLTHVARGRIWTDVIVLVTSVALLLCLALRSVIMPVVTVLRGVLVTAATFGILQLLLGGSDPILGGPGYMDPREIINIIAGAFVITITYSVVLLMRTREAFMSGTESREAVRIALRETAAPATGAGIVMIAALIPFATSEMSNLRGFGLGVAIAILLDILIVRPVLLPAAEAVFGRFGWWPSRRPPAAGESEAPQAPRSTQPRIRPVKAGHIHQEIS